VGPWGFGVLRSMTGSMTVGLLALAVISVCASVLCVGLRWHRAFAPLVGVRVASSGAAHLGVDERVVAK